MTVHSDTGSIHPPTEGDVSVVYARVLPRLKASFIDALILLFVFLLLVALSSAVGRLAGWLFFLVLILYEPTLVWRLGGTAGHSLQNLRVVADSTGGHPTFAQSLVRWFVKALFGVLSLVLMALTSRHQSLHDRASSSTVQPRDSAGARRGDFVAQRLEVADAEHMSKGRRILVILGYQAILFLLVSFSPGPLLSEDCLWNDVCSGADEFVYAIDTIVWILLGGAIVVQGWRGRLPGARVKAYDVDNGEGA